MASLAAVQVAQFVMASLARSRVLPSLCFMRKRLHLVLELDLDQAFRSARPGALGPGAKQVPVAQPAMLLELEQQIVAAHGNKNPDWLGLFATW